MLSRSAPCAVLACQASVIPVSRPGASQTLARKGEPHAALPTCSSGAGGFNDTEVYDEFACRGRQLVTLEDAGSYITKLPKAEHEAPEWQAAMEALILVATSGGPTMFARIGVMRAMNRHVERVFNPDRKDTHWGKRL
jgi:hypothetical protein